MTDTIRVAIVDDHPMIIDGLRLALDVAGIEVVASARNAAEVSAALDHDPDVVILDVHLPDGSGIRITERLRAERPGVAVLILTMASDVHLVEAALAAGASGYLVKGASREEIVRAVRAVADGQLILGAAVAATALAGLGRPQRFPTLSARERDVLELLADGLDNPTIARRLSISAKTVANHVSSILTKLQVADRTQAALLARSESPRSGR